MKFKAHLTFIAAVLLTYACSSVSMADYVIDDFQQANIYAPPSDVTVSTQTSSSDMSINRVASGAEGYRIVYSKNATGSPATATIEYSFTNGLRSLLPGAYPGALQNTSVTFYMPIFIDNLSEGSFAVSVRKNFSSGGPVVTSVTPDNSSNSMLEIDTQRTIADLDTNDITSIEFDITFSDGTYLGLADQVIIVGGGSGVNPEGRVGSFTAIPEPTSAAMIGCALVGLIARRRRKA